MTMTPLVLITTGICTKGKVIGFTVYHIIVPIVSTKIAKSIEGWGHFSRWGGGIAPPLLTIQKYFLMIYHPNTEITHLKIVSKMLLKASCNT